MDLAELCEKIRLQPEVTRQVLTLAAECPENPDLRTPGRWKEGLDALPREDPRGLKRLTISLNCALETWKQYQKLGLTEEIFVATMGCFPRFVGEHLESFGCYGFDREWWTVRQLSGRLFRIGELEYELVEDAVDLHIPSDANLKPEALRASWEAARGWIAKCFPEYAGKPMKCESWLLSPTLAELLPPDSRILEFQRSFDLTGAEPGEEFRLWVFKNRDIPNEDLPEHTSLQRNLKRFLLNGGTFLEGQGVLKEEPFQV